MKFLFILGNVLMALIVTLAMSHVSLNQENPSRVFNVWLASKDLQNRRVVVDYAGPETAGSFLNTSMLLISHHSYSYKEAKGSHLNGAIKFFAGAISKTIATTQKLNLIEQYNHGIRAFDVRVSLEDGVYTVDHGVIYGTLDDFFLDFRAQGLLDKGIEIFCKQSRFSPEPIENSNLRDIFRVNLPGVTITGAALWGYVDSGDYDEIYEVINDGINYQALNMFTTIETHRVVGVMVGYLILWGFVFGFITYICINRKI